VGELPERLCRAGRLRCRRIQAGESEQPDHARHGQRGLSQPAGTYLPDRAVDERMSRGDISPSLPEAKKESVVLLKASYASREDAARRLPAGFESFYK
jgi:hypothetical protein